VEVTSLAFRTDLALLQLGGSQITDCGDHLVVRCPDNPTFWWGNFLLIRGVPPSVDTMRWLDRFGAVFPDADHVALGFDRADGALADLADFARHGLSCDASTVMTAATVTQPARPNHDASYRLLRSDADWAQSLELQAACYPEDDGPEHSDFAIRRTASNRAVSEAGHGGWFGAFLDDVLVSQLGLVSASPGLARFQSVETHPAHRGRGLASTLVHAASQFGFAELGAQTLVMVADPDYVAVRIYRALGFIDAEIQLQAERGPSTREPATRGPSTPQS
jgi:ribosomal protein S18 acetylase RimI-like enzyme